MERYRSDDDKVFVQRGIGGFDFKTPSASIIESIKSLRVSQYLGNTKEANSRGTSDNQGLLGVPVDDDDIEMTHFGESTKIVL